MICQHVHLPLHGHLRCALDENVVCLKLTAMDTDYCAQAAILWHVLTVVSCVQPRRTGRRAPLMGPVAAAALAHATPTQPPRAVVVAAVAAVAAALRPERALQSCSYKWEVSQRMCMCRQCAYVRVDVGLATRTWDQVQFLRLDRWCQMVSDCCRCTGVGYNGVGCGSGECCRDGACETCEQCYEATDCTDSMKSCCEYNMCVLCPPSCGSDADCSSTPGTCCIMTDEGSGGQGVCLSEGCPKPNPCPNADGALQ